MASERRMVMIGVIGAAVGAVATAAALGSAAPVSTADRTAIETIVRTYILEHPEILPEAMDRLRARDVAKAVEANRSIIETPYGSAWEGAKDADVTLVEFFDYACGYCRASLPVIDRLLKEDPRLRIVYREFPVLGPDSQRAAHVSLIAAKAGNYGTFHRAMFAAGNPDRASIERVARQFGIDPNRAQNDETNAELTRNLELQRDLNLSGTPAWIVGDKVLAGAVGYDALKAAIAEARARK